MVSTKTSKTPRFTYAERALSAVSRLLRERRKASVHMASIRSEVKKTAKSKKDKLGPHWKTYLRKEVRNLENDDILAPTDTAGSVTMSPNGKKLMADTRRLLGLSGPLSPEEEDLVVKHVTRNKRSLGASPNTPPRKRTRTSLSGDAPRSKRRENELLAELEQMKRDLEQVEHERDMLRATREMSPLTDLDDDEEKQKMQEEIRELKRQLAELRQSQDESRIELDMADVPTRPSTPVSSSSFTFAFPLPRPSLSNTLSFGRSLLGVTRTQSGSLLSNLTRRPTPAPSTPGSDCDNLDDFPMLGAGDGGFSDSNRETIVGQEQLATPEPTPSRPCSSMAPSASLSWHSRGQDLNETRRHQELGLDVYNNHEARERDSHEETSSEVFSREAQLKDATAQLSLLQSDNDRLNRQAAENTTRIASLEAELVEARAAKENTESVYTERVAVLEDSLARLQSESVDAAQRISALEPRLSDSVKATDALRNLLKAKGGEVARLTQELREANEKLEKGSHELTCARNKLTEVETQRDELATQLRESDAAIDALDDELSTSEELAESLGQRILDKDVELGQLRNQAQTLQNSIENERGEREGERGRLQKEIEELKNAMAALKEELTSAERDATNLRSELQLSRSHSGRVQSQLDETKSEKDRLEREMEVLRQRILTLENKLTEADGRSQEAEKEIEELRESKQADEETIQRLKGKFTALRNAQMKHLEEFGNQFEAESSSPTPANRRARLTL